MPLDQTMPRREFLTTVAGLGMAGAASLVGGELTNAVAPAPWTLPSVSSYLTSTFPTTHGVLKIGQILPDDLPTIAETMRSAGYQAVDQEASTEETITFRRRLSAMKRGGQRPSAFLCWRGRSLPIAASETKKLHSSAKVPPPSS